MHIQRRKFGARRIVAVGAAAAFVAGLLALAAPASAGGQIVQSASATAFCDGGEGGIDVEIFDNFSTEYDVFIFQGDVEVDSVLNVTDTDEGLDPIIFAPLPDGVYTVEVLEVEGDFQFFDDVTVDCVPEVPVTDPAPPVTDTTPAPAPAVAAAASPRFTG